MGTTPPADSCALHFSSHLTAPVIPPALIARTKLVCLFYVARSDACKAGWEQAVAGVRNFLIIHDHDILFLCQLTDKRDLMCRMQIQQSRCTLRLWRTARAQLILGVPGVSNSLCSLSPAICTATAASVFEPTPSPASVHLVRSFVPWIFFAFFDKK